MKMPKDKNTLKPSVSLIFKTKHGLNTKRTWGLGSHITSEKLDNLNEAIREHKFQRAEGKGTWKLIPKDSCEVYRERRKRKVEGGGHIEDNAREGENKVTRKTGRRIVRRRQNNRRNRRKYTRPYTRRTTYRKREQSSESSIGSAECDCSCGGCDCGSPASTTSSARSTVTFSDMEYD